MIVIDSLRWQVRGVSDPSRIYLNPTPIEGFQGSASSYSRVGGSCLWGAAWGLLGGLFLSTPSGYTRLGRLGKSLVRAAGQE